MKNLEKTVWPIFFYFEIEEQTSLIQHYSVVPYISPNILEIKFEYSHNLSYQTNCQFRILLSALNIAISKRMKKMGFEF